MKGKSVLLVVHGMGDAEQGSTAQANVGMLLKAMKLRKRTLEDVRVEGSYIGTEHRYTDIS
ncbi:MAG TPA: hypothetical protein EYM41_08650 [Dehalococcoidia bacterium]|jgi:hypothetical protein|nr:hypothetical protein [Chloroflexota bacterium]MCH2515211.1 hypothetical protein [Dehalococcoidia bacterium]MQG30439.1 hypothetical protein [SAR202 cluster bacterium]MEE2842181.1 hypothetical protein [Chloroflexota bacterium]HAG54840.1 hypothetical protein [Dehalococcoidia bacterium]|tara:strand:+ start:205 stop:387 length:183 start_codon:yes stop_codon:yes gene_type:complete